MTGFVSSYFAGAVLHFPPDLIALQMRDAKEDILQPGKAAFFGGADEEEDGQDPIRTIRRELIEELGLAVPLVRLHFLKTYQVEHPEEHGVATKHIYVVEVPKADLVKIKPVEGHLLLISLPVDQSTLPLTDVAKTYLADAIPFILSLREGIPDASLSALRLHQRDV
jgi:8-oxo-dGTP pyrophosphatase MutT (NUDIX family)